MRDLVWVGSSECRSFDRSYGGCAAVEHQELDLERGAPRVRVHYGSDVTSEETVP